MREAFLFSLCVMLSGCASPPLNSEDAKTIFPFTDRPSKRLTLQHDIQIVEGNVYHFLQDGSRLTHHFAPVATILNSNTYVISVSARLDVSDFMSVDFDTEVDVLTMIAAAETYCEQAGYVRVGKGINIWVGDATSALVEFCIPEGIDLPPSYKAGDRVPRN
ncbi:MAG: hypothetical protein ABJ327_14430 [Litoreibacter sp.]